MRPWLALRHSGLPFREVKVGLDRPDSDRRIRRYSSSGLVPALIVDKTTIWDSLAICEYIAERAPHLLPGDPLARAVMRSYCAEMHSGFAAMRSQLSMDIQLSVKLGHLTDGTIANIERVLALWEAALKKSRGPYLFGEFSLADCFFAPVVMRFVSYGVSVRSPRCRAYIKAMRANPHVAAWVREAMREKPYRVRF